MVNTDAALSHSTEGASASHVLIIVSDLLQFYQVVCETRLALGNDGNALKVKILNEVEIEALKH